jgi:glutathione-regulated potassium-efflux system ancillary protein KefG
LKFVTLRKAEFILAKTLVIFAHPFFEFPDSNQELISMYEDKEQFDFMDLYEFYPNFHIPAFKERKRLTKYDTFIFHFPLIWFDIPPLLRLWLDEVMDARWTKKEIDNPLEGKRVFIFVTTISKRRSFGQYGKYKIEFESLLTSFSLLLKVLEAKVYPIYTVFDSEHQTKENIEIHKQNFFGIINQT